uniref:hypothetical protein n=1 Tax=Belnapia arida TaxID=2804533 RepID=UPI0038D14A5A
MSSTQTRTLPLRCSGASTQRGFGTRLLEQALPYDLGAGAAVKLHFELAGLRATVRFLPGVTSGR